MSVVGAPNIKNARTAKKPQFLRIAKTRKTAKNASFLKIDETQKVPKNSKNSKNCDFMILTIWLTCHLATNAPFFVTHREAGRLLTGETMSLFKSIWSRPVQ